MSFHTTFLTRSSFIHWFSRGKPIYAFCIKDTNLQDKEYKVSSDTTADAYCVVTVNPLFTASKVLLYIPCHFIITHTCLTLQCMQHQEQQKPEKIKLNIFLFLHLYFLLYSSISGLKHLWIIDLIQKQVWIYKVSTTGIAQAERKTLL